ncbi:MAG: hypothetical protein R6U52_01530 [Kosmotogaceae bacterium]
MNKNIDELRWVRVFTPDHIPHYLIEQVGYRAYSTEEFFKYHQINCLMQTGDGVKLNPFNHLYVLADNGNKVQGMLWFNVDPLSKDILIQTYSVDKAYWNKGQAIKKLEEHIKQIRIKANLNKIYWITNYPKHSMKYGFKPSKSVLMEYNPNEEVKNGSDDARRGLAQGKRGTSDSGTTKLPKSSDGGVEPDGTTDGPITISGHVSTVVCTASDSDDAKANSSCA